MSRHRFAKSSLDLVNLGLSRPLADGQAKQYRLPLPAWKDIADVDLLNQKKIWQIWSEVNSPLTGKRLTDVKNAHFCPLQSITLGCFGTVLSQDCFVSRNSKVVSENSYALKVGGGLIQVESLLTRGELRIFPILDVYTQVYCG